MKEKFLQIPAPLRKQLLLWLGGCVLSMATLVMVLATPGEWSLVFPCLLLVLVCAGSSWLLWDRCIHQRYVVIEGTCTEIERTPYRSRIKAIYLRKDDLSIKLMGVGVMKNLIVGDTVTVYVAETTDVYEVESHMVICSHLAIARGGRGNASGGNLSQTG